MTEEHTIRQPVFILGPERSGTTLLYSVLANADEFYWLSRIDTLMPSHPLIASVLRNIFQGLQPKVHTAEYKKISSMRGLVTPSECIPYWRNLFGWGDETDYLVGNDLFSDQDVTPEIKEKLNGDFRRRLKYSGKSRLLFKQPGFSLKIPFWNSIYEDALFIICTRTIEDNVRSLVSAKKRSDVNFWGTKVPGWRAHLDSDERTQSLYQLRKIYKIMLESVDKVEIRKRVLVVPYESVVLHPKEICRKIVEFGKVGWNSGIEESLGHIIRPEELSDGQKEIEPGNIALLQDYLDELDQLFEQNDNSGHTAG